MWRKLCTIALSIARTGLERLYWLSDGAGIEPQTLGALSSDFLSVPLNRNVNDGSGAQNSWRNGYLNCLLRTSLLIANRGIASNGSSTSSAGSIIG
jgi:hypothetical protein